MRIPPAVTSAQIVLIGTFEPRLFRPASMSEHALLGAREAEAAEVRVMEDGLIDFSTEWCRVFVTPERFIVTSQAAPWIRLSDLCLKLFNEVVTGVSMNFMGINRTVQFEAGAKARDKLGRELAPRSVWGEWGQVLERDQGKGESGLSTITMRQGHELTDRSSGYIEARLSPGPGTSIVVTVNDHYEATRDTPEEKAVELLELLNMNFEASIKRSDWIVDQIMRRVKP